MMNTIKVGFQAIYAILWMIWVPIWFCVKFTGLAIYAMMWITAAPIGLFCDGKDEFVENNPIVVGKGMFF